MSSKLLIIHFGPGPIFHPSRPFVDPKVVYLVLPSPETSHALHTTIHTSLSKSCSWEIFCVCTASAMHTITALEATGLMGEWVEIPQEAKLLQWTHQSMAFFTERLKDLTKTDWFLPSLEWEGDFENASCPSLWRMKSLGDTWGHCTTWFLSRTTFI